MQRYREAIDLNGQEKNVRAAAENGYDVTKEQGTTREFYDSLPLDGRETMQFFKNCASRQFPLTNLSENKLQPAETMAVQKLYFSVITMTADTLIPVDFETIEEAALPGLYGADWSIHFDTQTVVKETPLASSKSNFNRMAWFAANEVVWLATNISLIPNKLFWLTLRMPEYTPVDDTYLRCTWIGQGTIATSRQY